MTAPDELITLLDQLRREPDECEWLEFKYNQTDPDEIGQYISALSNGALLNDKEFGYLVWGVEDKTHNVLGTTFAASKFKIGNQALDMWLAVQLNPRPDFKFYEVHYQGKRVVLLRIRAVTHMPTRWRSVSYIRIGGHKTKLSEHPERERQIWLRSTKTSFELQVVVDSLQIDQVLELIDYPAYFELSKQLLPEKSAIIDRLCSEKFVIECGTKYAITNIGAILFARRLTDFPSLERKRVRVIVYEGKNKVRTQKERVIEQGYANSFESLIMYINDQLPANERIGKVFREEQKMYPTIAIRELVANALIHQDLTTTGDSPMIEIFSDRVEISNPGTPLVDTLRFIDEPPQSRNDMMAALMRRLNICEERGSGIDKVIVSVELFQLPAPEFLGTENHTKAILFAYRTLAKMTKEERIRACYQHACLCIVSNEEMTNTSLRKRFGIESKNAAMASRIISDTLAAKLIQQHDPVSSSRKHSKYLPFWAVRR